MPNFVVYDLPPGLPSEAYDGLRAAIITAASGCGLGLVPTDIAVHPNTGVGTLTELLCEIHGYFDIEGRGTREHNVLKQSALPALLHFVEEHMEDCCSVEVAMGSGLMKPQECLLLVRPSPQAGDRPWRHVRFNPDGSEIEDKEET